jgi:hypothetical protein
MLVSLFMAHDGRRYILPVVLPFAVVRLVFDLAVLFVVRPLRE